MHLQHPKRATGLSWTRPQQSPRTTPRQPASVASRRNGKASLSGLSASSPPLPPAHPALPEQADKLRTQQELERLQAKYVGTGHPDTTSWEWKTNIQRDTYASIVGHRPLLAYVAIAENEPIAKVRANLIRVRWPVPVAAAAA